MVTLLVDCVSKLQNQIVNDNMYEISSLDMYMIVVFDILEYNNINEVAG